MDLFFMYSSINIRLNEFEVLTFLLRVYDFKHQIIVIPKFFKKSRNFSFYV